MFLHRKETERLSNTWKWRLMQIGLFLLLVVPLTTLCCVLMILGTPVRLARGFYNWNRCQITSRKKSFGENLIKVLCN
jgi:hypothetical protein